MKYNQPQKCSYIHRSSCKLKRKQTRMRGCMKRISTLRLVATEPKIRSTYYSIHLAKRQISEADAGITCFRARARERAGVCCAKCTHSLYVYLCVYVCESMFAELIHVQQFGLYMCERMLTELILVLCVYMCESRPHLPVQPVHCSGAHGAQIGITKGKIKKTN